MSELQHEHSTGTARAAWAADAPPPAQLRHVQCPGASKAGPHGAGDAQSHRMAYWDWPAADDAGNAHLIVCVHGLTRNGRDFDVLAQRLRRKARVICPDVVGRGRSDWLADAHGYQIPTYVGDMLALLAELAQQAQAQGQPIARMDWVGTSMGGLIGLGLLTQPSLPLPLGRLVLNDVGPSIEWQALQRIGSYLGQPLRFADLQQGAEYLRRIAVGFGPHSDAQWLALSAPMLRSDGAGGLALHYDPAIAQPYQSFTQEAASAGEQVLWSLYDALRLPTLLLRGAQSDLLSAATAHAMTQRGPQAQLVQFEGVGHAPTLVQPEQLAVVEQFLLGEA